MKYYCTHFDINYIGQSLSLYDSLVKHAGHFTLFMFCMDDTSFLQLEKSNLSNVIIIPYWKLEMDIQQLEMAKRNRNRVEYFYTCSPAICFYVLKNFRKVDLITYLDADLFFFSSPEPLFSELADASVGIIEHRFHWSSKRSRVYGNFNVGWINFRKDKCGLECLTGWLNNCIEWCYQRLEDGKYADQKYLDKWVAEYSNVKILKNIGANLAIWNIGNYKLSYIDKEVIVDTEKLIFYHFASLKQLSENLFSSDLSRVYVRTSRIILEKIYFPYIQSLIKHQFNRIIPKEENFKNRFNYWITWYSRIIRRIFFPDIIEVKIGNGSSILGIDASNISSGGGIVHLRELLRAANPLQHGFLKVIIWSCDSTLDKIDNYPWLIKMSDHLLNGNLISRVYWQRFYLSRNAKISGCDILFVPGGTYFCSFRPVVALCQNMLPFEKSELIRYKMSWMFLKLLFIRLSQSMSFKNADGVIFLTAYAEAKVSAKIGKINGITAIIPHGIHDNFFRIPRYQKLINYYSFVDPFRVIYISTIDMYKHQWQVVKAISKLRNEGIPISLTLIGPSYSPALLKLNRIRKKLDPNSNFIQYLGSVPHDQVDLLLVKFDLFIFASTCENMSIILLEGMASGLPIACSNREPMPNILGDAGMYFDPEYPESIANSIRELFNSPFLRKEKAKCAFERAKDFSWERCSFQTFEFLNQISNKPKILNKIRTIS